MLKNNSKIIMPSIFYAVSFMAGGSFLSYIGLYYESINFDNTQIGIISSAGFLVGMLAQPMWGTLSDRSKNKTFILSIMMIVSALLIWPILISGRNYICVIISMAALSFFINSISPLGDSITLEIAKKENFKFSTVRTIGSAGFAISAAITGQIYAYKISLLFLICFILRLSAGIISFFISPVIGHKKVKERKDSFFDLFGDKKLNLYYVYIFILSVTFGFYSTFHAIYSKNIGIGTDIIGFGVMIGSFSQFPFMISFNWFYSKLGINKILIIAGLAYALRWFLYSFCLTPVTVLFISCMHGLTVIPLYLCLAEYISINIHDRLKTRGHMMNYLVLSGPSAILGSSLGGLVSEIISLKFTFFICTFICLLNVIIFIIAVKVFHNNKKI